MHPRFYVENLGGPDSSGLTLPEKVVKHLHVLGLKAGETITLFDGSGVEVDARLVAPGSCTPGTVLCGPTHEGLGLRRSVEVSVLARHSVSREPGVRVTLACAVPKGRRMDALVRMVAELGVRRIIPLVTSRSVVRPIPTRRDHKLQRWDAICIAASEQSGRNLVTTIDPAISFDEFLRRDDRDVLTVLLSPEPDVPRLSALLRFDRRLDLSSPTGLTAPARSRGRPEIRMTKAE